MKYIANKIMRFITLIALTIILFNSGLFVISCIEVLLAEDIYEKDVEILNEKSSKGTIICVHGFLGSINDFKMIGSQLSEAGYRVIIPRVPGQTKNCFSYKRGSFYPHYYIDWLNKIIEDEIQDTGRLPYIVGFSMGGTLVSATVSRQQTKKIILISPYFSLTNNNDSLTNLAKVLRFIIPVVPKISKGKIADKAGYAQYEPGSYLINLTSFLNLQELAKISRNRIDTYELPPCLVIFSPNDSVASFRIMKKIIGIRKQFNVIEYPNSDHILMYDYCRHSIGNDILSFIE